MGSSDIKRVDEEEAIVSSEDENHEKIWDFNDLEAIKSHEEGFDSDLESDDLEQCLKDDIILNKTLMSNKPSSSLQKDPEEKLWDSWETTLKDLEKLEMMKQKLKKSKSLPSDVNSFKRFKSASYERELEIKNAVSRKIPSSILYQLVADKLDTTRDWYFITLDPDFSIIPDEYSIFVGRRLKVPFEELFKKFGCDLTRSIQLTYCQYGELIPVDKMSLLIRHNFEASVPFFECFIRFILDRQVFIQLEPSWCLHLWKKFDFAKLPEYFKVVSRDMYMLHFRITRLIPIQQELADHLFPRENDVVEEFERLLDTKQWPQLLYFVMFLLGTTQLPFGSSPKMKYFRDCVIDLNSQNSSKVELSILKTYITMCMKQKGQLS